MKLKNCIVALSLGIAAGIILSLSMTALKMDKEYSNLVIVSVALTIILLGLFTNDEIQKSQQKTQA